MGRMSQNTKQKTEVLLKLVASCAALPSPGFGHFPWLTVTFGAERWQCCSHPRKEAFLTNLKIGTFFFYSLFPTSFSHLPFPKLEMEAVLQTPPCSPIALSPCPSIAADSKLGSLLSSGVAGGRCSHVDPAPVIFLPLSCL